MVDGSPYNFDTSQYSNNNLLPNLQVLRQKRKTKRRTRQDENNGYVRNRAKEDLSSVLAFLLDFIYSRTLNFQIIYFLAQDIIYH